MLDGLEKHMRWSKQRASRSEVGFGESEDGKGKRKGFSEERIGETVEDGDQGS